MNTTLVNVPGVQIKEVLLSGAPIAGVSTSIAGFVGIAPLTRFLGIAKSITSKDQFDMLYILADPVDPNKQSSTDSPPAGTTPAGTAPAGTTPSGTPPAGTTPAGTAPAATTSAGSPPATPTPADPASAPATQAQDKDATKSTPLSRAVHGFFDNGGSHCYIVNVDKDLSTADQVTKVTNGLNQLWVIDEISILAAPGFPDASVATALQTQAEKLGDRVALIDPPKEKVEDPGGLSPKPSTEGFLAYYYPRVAVAKELKEDPALEYVTPVGHIAGVYARVDASRGVHKAPANEGIRGVLSVEQLITDAQQEVMNPKGINAIRVFNGNVVIWGARTTSSGTMWRYINIRRLVNYIEKSLQAGLRWAVFEPNNDTLKKQITRSVRDFLTGIWRDGGLYGATADEAFYVRFPEIYNTGAERALGKLTMEIGLKPSYPAEFIIIRIGLLIQDDSAA